MNEQGPRPLIDAQELTAIGVVLLVVAIFLGGAFAAGVAVGLFELGHRLAGG